MAIIAQDNFNSYTTGSNLTGQNDGTGFTGAYTGTGATVNNPIAGNVNKIATNINNNGLVTRTFNSPASEKIIFEAYVNRANLNAAVFIGFIAGGNEYRFVFIPGFGNQLRYNGVTVGATDPFTTAGIFYKINISINKTITVNNIIFSVNNVAIATFSTTITSLANCTFVQSVSGFTVGLSFTEISFEDTVSVASNSNFFAYM